MAKIEYVEHIGAFDIETSSFTVNDTKGAIIYSYALMIDDTFYHVRTGEEFYALLEKIADDLGLSLNRRVVIFVHNLAYEWQFIKNYMEWDSAFAVGSERRIARAVSTLGFEFRCTYILTNKSLEMVGEEVGVRKMVGDIDHNLIRNSTTPLSREEMGYIENDVRALIAFARSALARESDDLVKAIRSIPTTKTGYVRRQMRKSALADPSYQALIDSLLMGENVYAYARHSFQGGYTHANSTIVGKECGETLAVDLASSYPSSLLQFTYPMSTFSTLTPPEGGFDTDLIDEIALCTHFFISFVAYDLESRYPFPYISQSKVHSISEPVVDNGRIYSATAARLTMTDVDWQIFNRCYKTSAIEIESLMVADKDYLPRALTDSITRMYRDKTALKGVVGQEDNYRSAKENINGVYGSIAMDPVRTNYNFVKEEAKFVSSIPTISESLSEYNNSRSRYLYYPWAAWVTAYSRFVLLNTIYDLIDAGVTVLYCDTDSIYLKPSPKAESIIDRTNERVRTALSVAMHSRWPDATDDEVEAALAPYDSKGTRHHIGLFELDGRYTNFKTLGAKRYVVEKDGHLKTTISGLSKRAGSYIEENGGMEVFDDGLTIPPERSGRLTHTYVEDSISYLVTDYLGNTCEMHQEGFVHLEPSPYVLSVSDTFMSFVQKAAEGLLFKYT